MRVETGIKGLDEMLNGGFLPGKVMLVSGPAGTGKTTFAMHFVFAGTKKGEHCLFITLEQNKRKMIEDMLSVGMDVKGNRKLTIIGGSLADIMRFQQKVKAKPQDFLDEIAEIVKKNSVKRVAIDSSNLFLMLFKNDEERRNALLALAEMLSSLGCTTLLTSEVRNGTRDMSWYGFEEFVVDGVITLTNDISFDNYYKNAIAVRKMRGSSHNKSVVEYKITDKGIVVFPDSAIKRRV
ncbi:MAG: ATPase domain-containing protein [Candidatus Aenigmatarchaeota archaeon]